VLLNLAGNAVKFTERGTVAVDVTARPTAAGKLVEMTFAVRDTGIGIAPASLPHLFQESVVSR
jgi:signal transduction histidine kinase